MPAKRIAVKLKKRASAKEPARAKKRASAKPPVSKKAPTRAPATRVKASPQGIPPLDLSAFPPESIAQSEKWLCLACVLDVFTRHMGLAPRTANLEIKRYTPSLEELNAATPTRPFFTPKSPKDPCPYCGSQPKWHSWLRVYRIESGKATDALRRQLVKSLPKTDDQFVLVEQKATGQHAFFEWIDKISAGLDFEDPRWLRDVSRHYLSRKEPKEDWQALFNQTHSIRRSRRLDSGWEVDLGRLFLAPALFDELLLVQYLASRSQKAGGLTLEGRYTLPEFFARLRNAGYLRAVEVHAHNPSDALEQLLDRLSGGETALKFYHIVDRRDLVEKTKSLREEKPPRPKAKPKY